MRDDASYSRVVLGAAFVIVTLSIGTLFTLGVLLKPIEEGMAWSRSSIGAIGLLNRIVMGLGGVVLAGGGVVGLGLVVCRRGALSMTRSAAPRGCSWARSPSGPWPRCWPLRCAAPPWPEPARHR